MKASQEKVLNLLTTGWEVGYTKTSTGEIRDGFAIKGRQSQAINCRILHSMYMQGVLTINQDRSILKTSESFDLSKTTGFAGTAFTESDYAEMKKWNERAEQIGIFGRIKFKIA